ncbi:MAG: CoA transferase subunit A [Chloroflexota bacterium]|nr:CoA transferase subunit A [Chloroflexota bacterium]
MTPKVMSMAEAVRRCVPDGASVALGLALEPAIPFALVHELVRARRRDLRLIGPISDMAFDILISAGCVAEIDAAWVGNVSAGLAHGYRRAMEKGIPRRIVVRDHSNLSIGLSLLAGALGSPYIPTRSLLGTDLARANGTFREAPSPFDGTPTLLLPAIEPDVAVLAVQRSDEDGNAQLWGPWGISQEAALASKAVIVVADELVDRSVIRADPNRTVAPAFKVAAVVVQRGACHPSPLQDRYGRDHSFFHAYHDATRSAEGYAAWAKEWILDLPDHEAYLAKLGPRWEALVAQERAR